MSRIAAALLILVSSALSGFDAYSAEGDVRVVMISLDGLKPSYVLEDTPGLEIPNLRKLIERGVFADGVTGVLPSQTYPSHTTLITGVAPSKHGIESNHVLDPEDVGQDPWYWFAEDIHVTTLIDAAELQGLVTGSVSWPVSIGLRADEVLPEFWRGWSRHPFDRRILEYFSTPGLYDAVARYRKRPLPGFSLMTDRDRTDVAKWIIETTRPDLLLIHLFDLDFAQHHHGPSSEEAFDVLEENDAMVGEILGSLQRAGMLDSTIVLIVSDHGFLPVHSEIAPNTLLVEEGLIQLDEGGRVRDWDAYFLCDSGSAALVLRDPDDRDVLSAVRGLLSKKAEEPGSGIFRILDRDTAAAMGSRAPLVIDAANGFLTSRRVTGPWSRATSRRGSHGYAPDREGIRATLIISGAPLRSRGTLGVVPMTRIAPTVASLMHLQLDEAADEPLPLELRTRTKE